MFPILNNSLAESALTNIFSETEKTYLHFIRPTLENCIKYKIALIYLGVSEHMQRNFLKFYQSVPNKKGMISKKQPYLPTIIRSIDLTVNLISKSERGISKRKEYQMDAYEVGYFITIKQAQLLIEILNNLKK